ncbi:hypothetical protein ACFQ48_09865 [Hymenobacter caeli]|uniref:Uncharacterized protein n=1 Tax=Hymenobacter caeli TaxID=2735894 RepID=A0ABX2FPN9_9BACT|nr:hypothetical protein [Hymenobacter caeli]NRT18379.1 hypothetical protein [Hymenobacter caeli]
MLVQRAPGFGGGVYVDVLKQAVVNVTYSVGEEKLVFVGFDFLFWGPLLPGGARAPGHCKRPGHGVKRRKIRF